MTWTPQPRALLFDLGGVLIDIDFDRVLGHWAQYSPLSVDEMRGRCVFDEPYHRYERGEIDDAAFFEHVRQLLLLDAGDADILSGWNAVFVGRNDAVFSLAARVARQLPSYVLTNTSASHQLTWSSAFADVVGVFRRVFSSAEMGLRKPERAIFDAVTEEIGVDPASILFFDDMPSNVAGAQAAGLQAVQVSGPDDVRATLRRFGLT